MSSESNAIFDRNATGPTFVDPESVFADARELLGRKWHPRIVYHLLEDGPLGFSGLKDRLNGVSSKMLSESLSSLEQQGMVDRHVVSDQPIRVEYALTERGLAVEPVIAELVEWSNRYGPATTEER